MIIKKRCTVCHNDIGEAESEVCGSCGMQVHTKCAEYVRSFDCPECADELEIGAVEF